MNCWEEPDPDEPDDWAAVADGVEPPYVLVTAAVTDAGLAEAERPALLVRLTCSSISELHVTKASECRLKNEEWSLHR